MQYQTDRDAATTTVIGGLFGLATTPIHSTAPPPAFLDERNLFFANATSGLSELIKVLRPQVVWLPSYLCVALLIAVRQTPATTRLYPVDGRLGLQSMSWLEEVKAGDVVVMIDYFGHLISPDQVGAVRARGAWVVEDATQAMLSDDAGTRGDFAIFSPRKFLGVADGGILMSNRPVDFSRLELKAPPADWWLTAFRASILRRQFDLRAGSGNREWFELFQKAEASAPVGAFSMSDLSLLLLRTCFDFEAIARRRCANYDRLFSRLGDIALFATRPPGTVPLGFPIRVKDRDRIRESLFDRYIYPQVHWPLRGLVTDSFAESHSLALEIMSLPCDHRYDERDMDRMSDAVRAAMA